MKKTFVAVMLLSCFLLAQTAKAQQGEVSLLGSVIGSRGLGYERVSFGGELYSDFRPFKRVLITNSFNLESARKVETNDGVLLSDRVSARFYLTDHLWAGGGGEFYRQSTSLWIKYGRRATFSAGGDAQIEGARVRPYVTVLFPDSTGEQSRGVRVGLEAFFQLPNRKWGFITRGEFSYIRFIEPQGRFSGNVGSFKAGIFRSF